MLTVISTYEHLRELGKLCATLKYRMADAKRFL